MLSMAQNLSTKTGQNSAAVGHKPKVDYSTKTDFASLQAYQEMQSYRSVADLMGISNPFFQQIEGRAGPTVSIDGREYINFSSYDYLGLNFHPAVAEAAKTAIDQYGTSVSASRPTAGNRPLHQQLEQQLAGLYQAEDCLTFVSGHATNVSVIGDLLGARDLVLYDALSHNSIIVGTKLSGATRKSYRHNDLADLENHLKSSRDQFDRVLIVVEGLYSMDGDTPDLQGLIELKSRYGAWLMVDEAHALGVLGANGLGIFEQAGVDPQLVDIWMGTLSKTLCGCGGYIAGNSTLIEFLRYNASGFMFSVGLSPPVAAAAIQALKLLSTSPERVQRLQTNGQYFLQTAHQLGLDTGNSQGFSVVPVVIGDSLKCVKTCNLLLEKGIFSVPVTYPAVPMQGARIRFFITSEHTREQIEQTLRAVADILQQLDEESFGIGDILRQ